MWILGSTGFSPESPPGEGHHAVSHSVIGLHRSTQRQSTQMHMPPRSGSTPILTGDLTEMAAQPGAVFNRNAGR